MRDFLFIFSFEFETKSTVIGVVLLKALNLRIAYMLLKRRMSVAINSVRIRLPSSQRSRAT